MISDASMLAALQAAINFIDGRKVIIKAEMMLLIEYLEAIRRRIIEAAAKKNRREPK